MELLSKEEEESLKRLKRKLEHQLLKVQQSLTESEKWKSGTSDDDPVGPQEWEENEEETTKKGKGMEKKEEEEKKGREEKEKETEKKKEEMKQKDETETKRSLSVGTTKDDEISIVDSEERERDAFENPPKPTNERMAFWESTLNNEAKKDLREDKEKALKNTGQGIVVSSRKRTINEVDPPTLSNEAATKFGEKMRQSIEQDQKTKEARTVLSMLLQIREKALILGDEAQKASKEVQKWMEKMGNSREEEEEEYKTAGLPTIGGVKCFRCNKVGHFARDCRAIRRPWNEGQSATTRAWNEGQSASTRAWNEAQSSSTRPWNDGPGSSATWTGPSTSATSAMGPPTLTPWATFLKRSGFGQ